MTTKTQTTPLPKRNFPQIKPDMVKRLTHEADLRTIQPKGVDWTEIHRRAAQSNPE